MVWEYGIMYFSHKDYEALQSRDDEAVQRTCDKLAELHKLLHRRLRELNYDLHPQSPMPISNRSATSLHDDHSVVLTYMRSKEQIGLVERLMGRDGLNLGDDGNIYRHPVIELRLTPTHFAAELVISPYAWWDQQNFIGKLSVQRHRETFRSILQRLEGDFRFGYWEGVELKDMHLTTYQLIRTNHLNDWTSTFADGQDWLRIGAWYEPQDPALEPGEILKELTRRVGGLYTLYTFILWTSNNDFHSFYHRINKSGEARL